MCWRPTIGRESTRRAACSAWPPAAPAAVTRRARRRVAAPTEPSGVPLGLDIKVVSGLIPFIENRQATIEGRANIDVGRDDRSARRSPGRSRSSAARGSSARTAISSAAARSTSRTRSASSRTSTSRRETRARAAGETFDVTIRVRGTFEQARADAQLGSVAFGGSDRLAASSAARRTSAPAAAGAELRRAGAGDAGRRALVLLTSPDLLDACAASCATCCRSKSCRSCRSSPTSMTSSRCASSPRRRASRSASASRARLPDLLAHAHRRPGRDHPARVRSERSDLVGALAQRGPDVRARFPHPARLLMRSRPSASSSCSRSCSASPTSASAQGQTADPLDRMPGKTVARSTSRSRTGRSPPSSCSRSSTSSPATPLRFENLRRTRDRFASDPRFENVEVLAAERPARHRTHLPPCSAPSGGRHRVRGRTPASNPDELEQLVREQYGGVPTSTRMRESGGNRRTAARRAKAFARRRP